MEGVHISARPCDVPCPAALASNIAQCTSWHLRGSQLPEGCSRWFSVDMWGSMHSSMGTGPQAALKSGHKVHSRHTLDEQISIPLRCALEEAVEIVHRPESRHKACTA